MSISNNQVLQEQIVTALLQSETEASTNAHIVMHELDEASETSERSLSANADSPDSDSSEHIDSNNLSPLSILLRADPSVDSSSRALSPTEIVQELDKYVIGQHAAKRAVAIALRNRWRRQRVSSELRDEIMPNNIIMIGPTGVGKTEIARRLSKLSGAPFVKVEATKFTEVGYVGRDAESMIRDLCEQAVSIVKAERSAEQAVEAEKAVEERLLSILVPPVIKSTASFDLQNEEDIANNDQERELMRFMLHEGALDDKVIELDISVDQMPAMHVMGPIGLDDMGINLQEMFSGVLPKKNKRRKMKVSEARLHLLQEEAAKLIDIEAVVKEALYRAEHMGIVFIDEIDKVASRTSSTNGPDVSREGVQRDLLPIVEGCTVQTKYGQVKTDHMLFIASGAFHVSKPSDLIPELQGRFPIRVELESLTEQDFVKILTQPENALIKQYQALLLSDGVKLSFDDSAIHEIASTAARVNENVTNIGARRLHTMLTSLLDDVLFRAPDTLNDSEIVVTAEMVRDRLSAIVQNVDLSKFML